MYKRILLAADFDEVGVTAAKQAREMANQYNAKLHLVHVVEPIPAYAYPGFAGFTEIEESLKEHVQEELEKLGKELTVPAADQYLEIGPTKHEVLRVAEAINADLIVVGSHGKHGLALLLGSTSTAITHAAHCDVLIVRTHK